MMLALILAAMLAGEEGEAPFQPSSESFATPQACVSHLTEIARGARGEGGYDAVEGPYDIVPGDTRIHMVRASGAGHEIAEHRCLAEKHSARTWHHSMGLEPEEFTIESVARTAEWLNKDAAKQQ